MERSASGGSRAVEEAASTGWDSVRPTSGRAGQMGLTSAPAVSVSSRGNYVFGSSAQVGVATHVHHPEALEKEVRT